MNISHYTPHNLYSGCQAFFVPERAVSAQFLNEVVNDPRYGDVHTIERVTRHPYLNYPNFVTEHTLTAPTAIHSIKKFVKGNLFPEGYTSLFTNDDELIMPYNWIERSGVGSLGMRKYKNH